MTNEMAAVQAKKFMSDSDAHVKRHIDTIKSKQEEEKNPVLKSKVEDVPEPAHVKEAREIEEMKAVQEERLGKERMADIKRNKERELEEIENKKKLEEFEKKKKLEENMPK